MQISIVVGAVALITGIAAAPQHHQGHGNTGSGSGGGWWNHGHGNRNGHSGSWGGNSGNIKAVTSTWPSVTSSTPLAAIQETSSWSSSAALGTRTWTSDNSTSTICPSTIISIITVTASMTNTHFVTRSSQSTVSTEVRIVVPSSFVGTNSSGIWATPTSVSSSTSWDIDIQTSVPVSVPSSLATPDAPRTTVFVSISPVATGSGPDLHPATVMVATTTITTQIAAGTPNPKAVLCGLHGLPVGDYFLAGYVEEKPGVAVTLTGCYEFCSRGFGYNMGCRSYEFYPEPGTNAPRCDLFGGSVSQSLDSINNYVPNVWYDLDCGNPAALGKPSTLSDIQNKEW